MFVRVCVFACVVQLYIMYVISCIKVSIPAPRIVFSETWRSMNIIIIITCTKDYDKIHTGLKNNIHSLMLATLKPAINLFVVKYFTKPLLKNSEQFSRSVIALSVEYQL